MTTVVLNPDSFPRRLQAVGWRRPVYVRGAAPGDGPAVAIVGARAASADGMDRAHRLARHLAAHGIHVVSGGALGIDGAAHRGALAAGGRTTVVLGSGVDVAYPPRHAPLFRDVLAGGGTLVGLLPDGTQPRPGTFPQRNPLIAALADAVIVVEADVRSGSLSTARAAQQLGRVVAAWPGSRGCERLLAGGAAIVEGEADAERVLGEPRRREATDVAGDPIAARIREAIAAGAVGIDAIVRHTGLTVRAVLRALPRLDQRSAPSTPGRER
ncbi:MAG TPA: DNA-processing protein DprA [Kofleriaceae bacterium]|nr:DNA-processing protein DprA [Kofleriaceae bacterium]